ncbi:hypothetical protein MKX01_023252 [Papaver californicum]|nr:hypothetical protein MKX01_023252 [Papaver californicum]
MDLYENLNAILNIQKFRRVYPTLDSIASFPTRAGVPRVDQFYASFPAGTELTLLSNSFPQTKIVLFCLFACQLYKSALGNCFDLEEWGPIEFTIMAKHFDCQGKPPYAYHAQYMAHLLSQGQLDGSGDKRCEY